MIRDLLFLPSPFILYPPTVQSQGLAAVLKNNNPDQSRRVTGGEMKKIPISY